MLKPKDNHGNGNHGNGDVETGLSEIGDDNPTPASHQQEADAILTKLKGELSYGIDDVPAWYTGLLLGFQVNLDEIRFLLRSHKTSFGMV